MQRIVKHNVSEHALQRSILILDSFKEIMKERNHVLVFNRIRDNLPRVLGFHKAAVFFVDPNDRDTIYTITNQAVDPNGYPFVKETAKYPRHLGVTGRVTHTREVQLITQKNITEIGFYSEIDNILSVRDINNMLIGPLIDSSGEVTGVVQVVNKDKGYVTEADKREFFSLLCILGSTVQNADELHELLNLSMGMSASVNKILSIYEEGFDSIHES